MYLPQEIIKKKRDNFELSKEEIDFFVQGITAGKIANEQISALAMAIFFQKLSKVERLNLTLAMRDSGEVLSWNDLDGPVADKHSTGGVGDLVSIILAPTLAACGMYLPMIVGRGLGHTGGTADKMDSIPNYKTEADFDLFKKVVKEIGCSIITSTTNLAPADKKIYAIRDISGCVESMDLISSSILSKKLAEGLQCLTLDIKTGSGAFMKTLEDSELLARYIVDIGNSAGVKTSALITDMSEPLANTIGNALEVRESVDYLSNKYREPKLHEVNLALGVQLLTKSKIAKTKEEAETMFLKALNNGKALEVFDKMVALTGGPTDFSANMDKYLPKAKIIKPVLAKKSGFVTAVNPYSMGIELIKLGGGRTLPTDKINHKVGFSGVIKVNAKINSGDPLCFIHADSEEAFINSEKNVLSYIEINEGRSDTNNPIIYKEII